jgi:hypothetical protein
MKYGSPLSIEPIKSVERCIICLSDANESSIKFPCIFSSCTCKYIMNFGCIQQYNINSCPICRAEIKYSKDINELKICDFQTNITTTTSTISGRDKIRKLKIVIPTTSTADITLNENAGRINNFRHEMVNTQVCSCCSCHTMNRMRCNRSCCVIFTSIMLLPLVIGIIVYILYDFGQGTIKYMQNVT